MELTLVRKYFKDTYTLGKLYVNGEYICDTLEDKNRDVNFNGKFDNGEKKVNGETCIPFGEYEITLKVRSPKYSKSSYFRNLCDGYLPRLLDVPEFEGVLIHTGNTAADSEGCILVGYNKAKGKVLDSRIAFEKLYPILKGADVRDEKITINIVKL